MHAKGSYWDNAFVKCKPSSVLNVLLTIKALEKKANLEGNLSKFHLHAPNEKVDTERKILLTTDGIKGFKIHCDMNILFLGTLVESAEFVTTELDKKLVDLNEKVEEKCPSKWRLSLY